MNQVRALRFVSDHCELIVLDVWLDSNVFTYYSCFSELMIREKPQGYRKGLIFLRLLDRISSLVGKTWPGKWVLLEL